MQTIVPGTSMPYEEGGMFALFRPMIRATDGLTLRQVCSLTGLEPSTIQNWIKRGYVAHPVEKKYRERQLARILLISALRDCMKIDSIGALILAAVPGIKHHGVVGLCHHRQGVGRAERRGDTIRRGGCNKGLRSHRRHRAVAAQRSADRDGVCVHGRDL